VSKRKGLSAREALDLVPDNMGEMAQVALAAEMAGMDFNDALLELAEEGRPRRKPAPPKQYPHRNPMAAKALRELNKARLPVVEFVATHWRVGGHVDFWPTTGRWRFMDGSANGRGVDALIAKMLPKAKP
jgi:hypothetical protein